MNLVEVRKRPNLFSPQHFSKLKTKYGYAPLGDQVHFYKLCILDPREQ